MKSGINANQMMYVYILKVGATFNCQISYCRNDLESENFFGIHCLLLISEGDVFIKLDSIPVDTILTVGAKNG